MAYADLQTITLLGRIADLKSFETTDGRTCLAVTLYHRISEDAVVTVKFLNSNGLLTAFVNDNLVVGQELTVTGKIQGIRAFYMKDDELELVPLKQPEFQLRVMDYAFGSKPQPKAEPKAQTKTTTKKKATPDLELVEV